MSAFDLKFDPTPDCPWSVFEDPHNGHAVTVLTRLDGRPAGKQFRIGGDGTVKKSVTGHAGRYRARTVPCADLAELQAILAGFTEADVLVLAYIPAAGLEPYTLLPQAELRRLLGLADNVRPLGLHTVFGGKVAARLKPNFVPSRFLMIDRDIAHGAPAHLAAESRAQFWEQAAALWPALAGAARLVVPSSSNRVAFADGRRCFASASEHIYIELAGDGWENWDALRKTLEARAAAGGLTYTQLASNGAALTRSVMDFSVISVGREIFESAPAVGPGLARLAIQFERVAGGTATVPAVPVPAHGAVPHIAHEKRMYLEPPCAVQPCDTTPVRCPAVLEPLAMAIANAADGAKHMTLNRAAYTAGGWVAGGAVTLGEARAALRTAIGRRDVRDIGAAFATIEAGLRDGQLHPLYAEPEPEPNDGSAPGGATLGEKSDFRADLSRLAKRGAANAARLAPAILKRYAWQSPRRRTFAELAEDVIAALPAGHPEPLAGRLRGLARWLERTAKHDAKESTAIDPGRLASAGVAYERVTTLDGLAQRIGAEPDAVWLVKAPHGAGKTEAVLKPLAALTGCAVAVTNRIALVADLCKRLTLDNYQDATHKTLADADALGICLPSVGNPKFDTVFGRCDIALIDEVSACLRELHTVGGTVKRDGPNVTRRVAQLLDGARVACGVDADLSTADVLRLAALVQRPVRVVEMLTAPTGITVDHADDAVIRQRILEAVLAGQRCRVACDSPRAAVEIAAMVRAAMPSVAVVTIHSRGGDATNGDPDVLELLKDINAGIATVDLLIHSPTVESGVSLTVPHFDRTFGIFTGKSVAPSAFVQMLRRDRTAARLEIGFAGTGVDGLETDPALILTNMEAAHRRTAVLARDETGTTVRIEPASAWDRAAVAYRAAGNADRNASAQRLLLLLESRGFTLNRVDGDPLDKTTRQAARVDAEAAYTDAVLDAVPLTADARADLATQYQPNPEERAAMERFDACAALGLADDALDADELRTFAHGALAGWNRALDRLRGALTPSTAVVTDEEEAPLGPALARRELATIEAVQTVFEIAGFDRVTGAGEVSAHGAAEVFANLKASPCAAALEAAGMARFQRTPRYPVRWLGDVLQKFGLSLVESGETQDRKRLYRIAPDMALSRDGLTCKAPGWDAMVAIQARRLAMIPADGAGPHFAHEKRMYLEPPCAGQFCDTY